MAKKSDDKPKEVLEAERHGGQTFDPTEESSSNEPTTEELLAEGKCPDCKGKGILSPEATQVCQTCQGTGKA